jgi:hypothetical protein
VLLAKNDYLLIVNPPLLVVLLILNQPLLVELLLNLSKDLGGRNCPELLVLFWVKFNFYILMLLFCELECMNNCLGVFYFDFSIKSWKLLKEVLNCLTYFLPLWLLLLLFFTDYILIIISNWSFSEEVSYL